MSTRRNTPLTSNGATTRTQALLPGSQAINTGSNPLGLATDQRGTGFPRVWAVSPTWARTNGSHSFVS